MIVVYVVAGLGFLFLLTVLFGPPYVPSHRQPLLQVFDYVKLSKRDVLVDLGSGDGRVLRLASPLVKRGVGVEINPVLVLLSRVLSWRQSNLEFRLGDASRVNLPVDTTVVYVFGTRRYLKALTRRLQTFTNTSGRRLTVISYGFQLPLTAGQLVGPYYVYHLKPFTKS